MAGRAIGLIGRGGPSDRLGIATMTLRASERRAMRTGISGAMHEDQRRPITGGVAHIAFARSDEVGAKLVACGRWIGADVAT